MIDTLLNVAKVIFAFGFVIFWHELGHFLAARWAGVRVEQFAVGMGQALISWRKGIGMRIAGLGRKGFHWGSTQDEFERRVYAEHTKRATDNNELPSKELPIREQYDIARDLGIGETEYRLSWVPLGGYVKPTGQDDLRPANEVKAADPHSYGAKSVGKRMVIISAGVVMNVIMAFALYILLFVYGFNAPPSMIGYVQPGSPAQQAGLQIGDTVESINGIGQEDFTKIQMNISLLRDDEQATFVVRRPGVTEPVTLKIQPIRTATTSNMPGIGIGPGFALVGQKIDKPSDWIIDQNQILPAGATVTKVNGKTIGTDDFQAIEQAAQASNGKPISVEITLPNKSIETRMISTELDLTEFGNAKDFVSIAGIRPRIKIAGVKKDSLALAAGFKVGDVIEQLSVIGTGEVVSPPTNQQFKDWLLDAADKNRKLEFVVSNNNIRREPIVIAPGESKEKNRAVGLQYNDFDIDHTVVGFVAADSPFQKAGIKIGEQILSINNTPMNNWFEIIETIRQAKPGDVSISVNGPGGTRDAVMTLDDKSIKTVQNIRYAGALALNPLLKVRQTRDPATLIKWSWTETKFSIIQVYLTLQRLFQGTVPMANLSGPLGIVTAGSSAADRGTDWLIWFTALISANLAVVNFLPIPIVDGGHFMFLLAEKVTGKPPSPKVQAVAQVIGLVLLGSLFLFVTYHDILRQIG